VAAPKEFRSNTLLLIVTGSDVGTSVPAPTVMPAAATVIAEFASLAPPLIVKLGELIVAAATTVVVNVDPKSIVAAPKVSWSNSLLTTVTAFAVPALVPPPIVTPSTVLTSIFADTSDSPPQMATVPWVASV